MKYKTQVALWTLGLIIVGIVLSWLAFGRKNSSKIDSSVSHRIVFNCNRHKQIKAAFGDGYVRLKLNNGRHFMLKRAESASGARYANKDEKVVFWNKGNTAFITRNDTMWFSNCVQKGQQDLVHLVNYTDNLYPVHFRYPKILKMTRKNVQDTSGWSYAGTSKGQLITQLKIGPKFKHKTNLLDATFTVGRSRQMSDSISCLKPIHAPMLTADTLKRAGQLFVLSNYSEAGAGNIYTIKQYRTIYHKRCYSIEEMVHTTHVQNYPPERGITAFDSASVWKALNVPWLTFSFIKTHE